MVTEGSTAPLVRKISSNQGQIEQATKAWGLETRATNHKIAVDTDAEPMAIDADIAKHLPPETSRDDHSSLLRSFRDQLPESPEEPSVQHSQEEIQHAREEEVRLHAQLEEERARVRELHAQKLEVARFQMMQRQRMDESTENTLDGSRTKIQHAASNGKGADQHQHTQLPGSAIAEAKRALQAHKDRETALAEQLAQKKAETRRLLEERKQRELAELRKREEEERAAEVERAALAKEQEERAAELERAAITKEQELIAEQGRKRQEILALKQRVSAETAARINAERAREKQKNLGVSPQTTSSISQQPPLPAEPVVATKQEPSDTKKKTKTLSGGLKLGPVAPEHEPHSLPPSPGVSRPAQLGLHTSRAQPTHADDTLPSPQLNEHSSHNANATAQSSSQKTIQRTSTPIVDRNSTGNVLATRRSEDAGNVYIACSSQALPMSPEAQAVNLRFIKDRRSAGRETPPHLQKTKSHPGAVTRIPMDENVTIKQESPAPVAFEARKSSSAIPRERDNVEPRSLHTIPVVQESASSQPTTESHDHPEPTRLVSVNELRSKPENAAPIISPVAPSTTIVEATQPDSSRPETLPMHTLPSAPSSNNPHRDNSSLPRINSRPPPTGPSSTRFPVTLDPRTAAADLNNYNDSSQIAPTIQSNDGWDRATDEELYNYRDQESRSPLRTRRRDNDHYSPMPMSISRSCSPSSPRSPVLGKRRYREELRDEPPARRQRHLDRPYGGRSPPRGPSQWRRASPNQPNLQTRMQANDYDMPRSRSDSSREFARRSPSLERPALQSRIGSDVYNIGGGESYRPTYPSGAYSRPQPRTRGAFKSNQPGYPSPSRSRSGSDRSPSLPRGPRRANNPRAAPRSRAGRGGSRALNLEQRISSYDEPSLMNRLRSPPTRPY
ncbi:hypothetical protein H0H92_007905 [Tricholoma furcatifolium]|nr:hypothetical protein H0H92_007905 [Tricholoma furcatifolium]